MSKLNFFKTFDVFFRIIFVFLFLFIWFRYYIRNIWFALLATVFCTIIIEVIYNIVSNKKNKNKNIKQSEKNDILAYTNTFVYGEQSYTLNFFLELAQKKHSAIKQSNYIIIDHISSQVILYPCFMYRNFTADDVIYIYNKVKKLAPSKIIICTNNIDNSALKITNKFSTKIFVLDYLQTYIELLKKYNMYPKKTIQSQIDKQTYKQLIAYALNKKRTKGYFITSILLLFCSFLVPYKLYYVIMSSFLLLLSYFSFVNNRFNNQTPNNLLEIN